MKMLMVIKQRLGWKLFLSYLVIILVGVLSLAIAAQIQAPTALSRHMANMQALLGDDASGLMDDLQENFASAVNEVLLVATTIAVLSAVFVSSFVTRRVVSPIQAMTVASQRIADGRYEERVQIGGEDELAELAQTFNQMASTLAQTEERRRQLIGDVAHELRTPLSSIRGVMEGIIDGVLPADPGTFLNVQSEVSRLQRLVQDLEELSRAEAGQLALEMSLTSPAEFIRPAAERLQPQFGDKGILLTLDIPSSLPRVRVDTARMTQVFLNLLGNALQYTPAGGDVTVRARSDTRRVIIAVQDTGIGLSDEQIKHIFERFYRVDESRARAGGGSGIGLTISKYLVEAHNGQISVTSPGPDNGSTFTITLPANA